MSELMAFPVSQSNERSSGWSDENKTWDIVLLLTQCILGNEAILFKNIIYIQLKCKTVQMFSVKRAKTMQTFQNDVNLRPK